jgi:hypothetical protein
LHVIGHAGTRSPPKQVRAWEAGRDARLVELHERIERLQAELAAEQKPA